MQIIIRFQVPKIACPKGLTRSFIAGKGFSLRSSKGSSSMGKFFTLTKLYRTAVPQLLLRLWKVLLQYTLRDREIIVFKHRTSFPLYFFYAYAMRIMYVQRLTVGPTVVSSSMIKGEPSPPRSMPPPGMSPCLICAQTTFLKHS